MFVVMEVNRFLCSREAFPMNGVSMFVSAVSGCVAVIVLKGAEGADPLGCAIPLRECTSLITRSGSQGPHRHHHHRHHQCANSFDFFEGRNGPPSLRASRVPLWGSPAVGSWGPPSPP